MSVIYLVLRTLLASARKKPWEPLLIVSAVALATAGLTAVLLINEGARQGELASEQTFFDGITVSAKSPSQPLTRSDYVFLRQAGFTSLIAIVEDHRPLTCQTASSKQVSSSSLRLVGIDMLALPSILTLPLNQHPHRKTNYQNIESAASAKVISQIRCQQGIVRQTGSPIAIPKPLSGLPANTVIIAIRDFYTGGVTPKSTPLTALIAVKQLTTNEKDRLQAMLPEHLVLNAPPTFASKGTLVESFRLNLWAMGLLMAVVSLFIVINALFLMYRARLFTFMRMRQLGVSTGALFVSLYTELTLYCMIACPVGVIAGGLLTREMTPVLESTFANLFEAAFVAPSPLLFSLISQSFLVTLLALSLFFPFPVRQLSRALSPQRVRVSPISPLRRFALTAVVMLVPVLALFLANSTVTSLFAVATTLLAGCVIIILWLPLLTQMLTKWVPKRYPLLFYTVASTHALSGKSRLAVCAFFIAISANIGMNVMTNSFRLATESWLTQRFPAPYFLYSDTLPDSNLKQQHYILRPHYRGQTDIDGQKVMVSSFPSNKEMLFSLSLTDSLKSVWSVFEAEKGVFINQQFAFRHQLSPGDQLLLDRIYFNNNKQSMTLRIPDKQVLGIYPDYGNPDAQLLVPLSEFSNPSAYTGVAAIFPLPGFSVDSLPFKGELHTTEDVIDRSMKTFDRTFVVTDALNVATLLVAGLAFAISVSLLTLDLRPQLSVLRAMGVRQWQMKSALASQYLLLCFFTALLALPFGELLAWVFIHDVNRFAFHWVYPLETSPWVLIKTVLFSLLVVLVVLLLPLGRLKPKIDLRQQGLE